MSLHVVIQHDFPTFNLQAEFESAGRLTALFGPSGCGKTTITNIIAGLVRPRSAHIVYDGRVLADSARGIWLSAHERQIGYVFQDARLLPHLSVLKNLRYGRWFTPQSQRYATETDVIELLGLAQLLDRRPNQLSGGERQRVAIGRALLQSPRLLLMDEPLASLDHARKQDIIPYIERLRDETKVPIILVSHDVTEVTRLATDLVLMAKGRVVACGPLAHVMPQLAASGEEFSRDAGAVVEARITQYDQDNDLTILASGAGELKLAGHIAPPHSVIRLHVRATDVTLAVHKPVKLSALNVLEGVIDSMTSSGQSSLTVAVTCGGCLISSHITRYSAKMLELETGTKVYAIIKAMSVRSDTLGVAPSGN
jgi:molybdate transport system ATP-binding protein